MSLRVSELAMYGLDVASVEGGTSLLEETRCFVAENALTLLMGSRGGGTGAVDMCCLWDC